MDSIRHLQREVKMNGVVPNPDKDGFACSTFNAQNSNGDNHDGRGYDRYETIEMTLKSKYGMITEDDAMDLLSKCVLHYQHKTPKHMVITLWSSVYNCNEKSMLMCAGMDCTQKYKFYIDSPGEVIKL